MNVNNKVNINHFINPEWVIHQMNVLEINVHMITDRNTVWVHLEPYYDFLCSFVKVLFYLFLDCECSEVNNLYVIL